MYVVVVASKGAALEKWYVKVVLRTYVVEVKYTQRREGRGG